MSDIHNHVNKTHSLTGSLLVWTEFCPGVDQNLLTQNCDCIWRCDFKEDCIQLGHLKQALIQFDPIIIIFKWD